jgi:hypothetical protein
VTRHAAKYWARHMRVARGLVAYVRVEGKPRTHVVHVVTGGPRDVVLRTLADVEAYLLGRK